MRALNSLFQQWDLQAPAGSWNISGEPCSGTAINGTKLDDVNPALICNCTLDPIACHITQLKINALNKRGVIPEELATLKYLQIIFIDENSFTGTLPAFIGNLSRLIVLSVAHNAFYGSIPKELGNLKELEMLALGTNNFSGTLPYELGYLPKLGLLYLDSSGIGGEIPSTFANLTNMVVLYTTDSPFTGKIPDFIGSWTKLLQLRIQGNNFEGPIPSSFSNLTSLTSLRITDLHNVSSSLDFIKNMRNLSDLILRNALISDTLPSDIDKYQLLSTLDLSFNNINGPLPSRLMNMTALTSLFLGNNSLSGPLLPQMNDRLQNIDFSYNELSGTFPQWVYPSWLKPNLQLNLVGNNFRFDSSNISSFPGLHCLQRNFPCNRNPPPNADFSINCGGPAVRSRDGTLYETENSTALGPAAYYVTQEKWAVSNVGVVIDRENPTYITTTNVQVANTITQELFHTSRTSPGSLRYYGLGLQNRTYTVSLFFAETLISDRSTQTWRSRGRRVFDIYIQGIRREKDFDISKEAGGVNRAIQKNYQVTVTQNYLEIHLFWAGKGTCCIPRHGDYGPLISALSVSSGSRSSAGGSKKSRTGLIVGISVAGGVLSLTLLILLLYFKRRGSKRYEEEEILGLGPKPNTYSYSELKTATDDFNPSNKLGEGGFGPVYKGKLNDGRIVAVKQLSIASHQGKNQFITEISTISAVQHWNLVKLYGFCAEGPKRLLVYEYLENRSLDQSLFGKNDLKINWPTRFSICLGTARGLAYLHEESRPRIVHRDVKASNILLDAELCPKLSDFGLAKLYDDKKTHISTRVAGTIGYLAPEYAMRGHLTSKADVFGFGVVSLEILSGRPNFDDGLDVEKKYLLEWAWSLHISNRGLELVDPTLTTFDEQEAMRVLGVALLCTQASPGMRPCMSRVVGMLAGDIEVNAVTTKPSYLTDWDFSDITTGSSYLDQEEPLTSNTSSGVDALPSSLNSSEPMLNETIRDGR
ncbi:hypothetical protein LguiA_014669 [Lonicera macranthoides]